MTFNFNYNNYLQNKLGNYNDEKKAISFNDLINYKEMHLKIEDILSLNKDDTLEIICLDRNIYDLINHNINGQLYKSNDFFKDAYQGIFKYNDKLSGQFQFIYNNEPEPYRDFIFHIEYEPGNWYPLNNDGKFPNEDPQEIFQFPDHVKGLNWDKFSIHTRIGWRGPMIKKELLNMYIYKTAN